MDNKPKQAAPSRGNSLWQQQFTIDTLVRIILVAVIVGALVWLLNELRNVLMPFVVGCLLAYLFEPLVKLNMRMLHITKHRVVPAILTILEVACVIVGFVAMFLPEVIRDSHKVSALIKQYANTDPTNLPFLPEWVHRFIHGNVELPTISEWLSQQRSEKVLGEIANFFSGGLDALGGIIGWAIVILYLFFILINYPSITDGIRSIVPPKFRPYSNAVINDTSATLKRYFRTQALISAIVGVIYAIGFSIVGLPLGIAVGLFNAVLFMVPYLVYVSIIPVTLLCIVCSVETGVGFWEIWLKCVAVYVVSECTADLWLTPRIMGKSMNLDPAVMLLSLSVWGTLLGFLGMILAFPLTVIVMAYYRRYILLDTSAKLPE